MADLAVPGNSTQYERSESKIKGNGSFAMVISSANLYYMTSYSTKIKTCKEEASFELEFFLYNSELTTSRT
jgi:hypothetical protein